MSFLNEDYCALQLKRNIRVEQPDELDNFQEKLDRSETFCVGQIHYHEFEKEAFVADGMTFTDIEEITKSLKVYRETCTNWYIDEIIFEEKCLELLFEDWIHLTFRKNI